MAPQDLPVEHQMARKARYRVLLDTPVGAGALALAAVAALSLWTGVWDAMLRPLWLDEVVSQLIGNAPNGILHAMRSGADFQPPPHYALLRLTAAIGGDATAVTARLPSLIAAALSVVVLAAALRPVLSLAASLAGALALAAHPLFLSQAFEARPYALWILATALLAESLREGRTARPWLVAGASVALCTVHYFGLLSLAAVGIAAVLHARLGRAVAWPAVARSSAPLAAGGVALLALLPLASDQLAASGGRSWVPPATSELISTFLLFPWGWRPAALLIAAGALVIAAQLVPAVVARWPRQRRTSLDITVAALLATALLPLLVVLLSITYKPLLVLRYSAPAALAVATLCALAVERLTSPLRWAAVLLLLRAAFFSFDSMASGARANTAAVAGEVQAVSRLAARGVPAVSPLRHDAYRTSLVAAGGPGVAWMELSDSLVERAGAARVGGLSREMLLVERDFGRAVRREFAFPAGVTVAEVRAWPRVALLRDAAYAGADTLWLPGWQPCPLSDRLVVFAAPPTPPDCRALRAAVQDGPIRR
ncbi:MAG: glycosyltransferase family 39 protein [Gemmatimonadaceae bacterium]|nr:glycosyltransferase family 39 protein [Gemmatimonadaceae bacterium]